MGTVKAGNKVPPMFAPRVQKEKELKLEQIPEKTPARREKFFSKLDLTGMMDGLKSETTDETSV